MRNGFRFKNKSTHDFRAVMQTKARTLLPSLREYSYTPPLCDGSYDFSDINEYGRAFYEDRVFEITLHITADELCELERKAARLAMWLTGKGTLKFDDMSSSYEARVISNVAFTPELRGKKATVSVIFQADSIGKADFNTLDGIMLDNCILLDSNIPLDMSEYFIRSLRAGENTVKFVNIGDFYARPKLIFDGAESLTIRFEDTKITIEDLESDIIIDLEKCIATNSNGDNLMSKINGRFFELPSGNSTLEIYADKGCEMKIAYTPKTIYDFDFSGIDWGDGDA